MVREKLRKNTPKLGGGGAHTHQDSPVWQSGQVPQGCLPFLLPQPTRPLWKCDGGWDAMRRLAREHACAGLHGSQMGGKCRACSTIHWAKKYILASTKGILSDRWLDCRADVLSPPTPLRRCTGVGQRTPGLKWLTHLSTFGAFLWCSLVLQSPSPKKRTWEDFDPPPKKNYPKINFVKVC